MNVHKNARLTPSGRVLLVQRIAAGWSVGRAAEAGGVSARTAYRWLSRSRSGDHHLSDRSSAPLRCPHRLAGEQIAAAERFIQTSLREWAYARPYASSAERTKAIAQWADTYNRDRPHAGIGASARFKD